MNERVRVGQVWRDLYPRHTDETRLVRIDKIETILRTKVVQGVERDVEVKIARVSSKTGRETTFTPVTRFIQVSRFGRFYKLHKGK